MIKSSFPRTGNPRRGRRKRSPKKNMEMKIKTKQRFFFFLIRLCTSHVCHFFS